MTIKSDIDNIIILNSFNGRYVIDDAHSKELADKIGDYVIEMLKGLKDVGDIDTGNILKDEDEYYYRLEDRIDTLIKEGE